VFGQWLHLYEINDQLVLNVIAALHRNFGSYEIYLVSDYDILIVAGKGPQLRRPDWSVLDYPALQKDLEHLRPIDREVVEATYLADRAAFAPLLDQVVPNSDFYPVLDLGTERTRYMLTRADGFAKFNADRFDLVSAIRNRRAPLGVALVGAVAGIPRVRANGLSARLRAAAAGAAMDSLPKNATFEAIRFRHRTLEAFFASGIAPSNWRSFVHLALDVERDVHGGAAGVANESFYESLFAYMRAAKAPPAAVAAINYTYALASWDWRRALSAGDTLAQLYIGGIDWVPIDFLRDGLVVAQLRLGDPIGARRTAGALASYSGRDPQALRSLMLESYIIAAEEASALALRPVTPRETGTRDALAPKASVSDAGSREPAQPRTGSGRIP
jgi:hypothetical protein